MAQSRAYLGLQVVKFGLVGTKAGVKQQWGSLSVFASAVQKPQVVFLDMNNTLLQLLCLDLIGNRKYRRNQVFRSSKFGLTKYCILDRSFVTFVQLQDGADINKGKRERVKVGAIEAVV